MKKLIPLLLLALPALAQSAGLSVNDVSLRRENRAGGHMGFGTATDPYLSGRVTLANSGPSDLKDVHTTVNIADANGKHLIDMLAEDVPKLPANGSKAIYFYKYYPARAYDNLTISFDITWSGGKITIPPQPVTASY